MLTRWPGTKRTIRKRFLILKSTGSRTSTSSFRKTATSSPGDPSSSAATYQGTQADVETRIFSNDASPATTRGSPNLVFVCSRAYTDVGNSSGRASPRTCSAGRGPPVARVNECGLAVDHRRSPLHAVRHFPLRQCRLSRRSKGKAACCMERFAEMQTGYSERSSPDRRGSGRRSAAPRARRWPRGGLTTEGRCSG